jgi:hypothetical protein
MERSDQPKKFAEHTATVLRDALEVLKEAIEAGFLYMTLTNRTQFAAAFENESLLGNISLLEHIANPEKSTHSQ